MWMWVHTCLQAVLAFMHACVSLFSKMFSVSGFLTPYEGPFFSHSLALKFRSSAWAVEGRQFILAE
jgi:hypothetical protein